MSYEEFNRLINDDIENLFVGQEYFHKGDIGIPVHLLIDCVSYYKKFSNQKFIVIQNNYENDKFDWQKGLEVLLMTISDNPQMYLSDLNIKLKNEDIEIIRQFVIKYKEKLEEFADQTWIDNQTCYFHKWYKDIRDKQ